MAHDRGKWKQPPSCVLDGDGNTSFYCNQKQYFPSEIRNYLRLGVPLDSKLIPHTLRWRARDVNSRTESEYMKIMPVEWQLPVSVFLHFILRNLGRFSKKMSKESVHDLAYRGRTNDVKRLTAENEKLKTEKDNNGRLLIHWAALGGHDDLVRYLLSLDVPVDPVDDMEMTPLILAASAGREKVVNTLLKEGANVNATTSEGHSALQYAASKNWKSICMALLENHADVNITDKRGATPLHRAASKGNTAIVKLLIDHGTKLNIDQKDAYGNTALHMACEEDRGDEAKLLVSNGANLQLLNKDEKTPLNLAKFALSRELQKIQQEPAH